MTLNRFTTLVRRQPFRPFSIVMTDGRSFVVDHPEFVASSPTGRELTFYAANGTMHLIDARLVAELATEGADQIHAVDDLGGGE